ncbi:O-linked N-acetylglucosamine transferase, SPINDLY family protein [Paraburkholderia susongensis]|uniref:Predicted O-linked N-acetylglucosamine transferase, SPINDLY family n=1 Tax=Paraburkholderia susongensis TaxID=1515439 RepID=A0A1X7M4V8_9BURK|nr:UDP-N-acetylglucosamine-peptide N-acetylglucosaminyltransferase [Paraburkholderia susongensis]SMG61091.1 Predicted O-linked N-acetylglucosamine transferase, SPINDLY family [Paraburkholderia susongensis]
MKQFNKVAMIELADEYAKNGDLDKARRIYQKVNEWNPGDFDLVCKELVCSLNVCNWQRYDYLQRVLRDTFRHKGGLAIGEPLLASPYFTADDLLEASQRHMQGFVHPRNASAQRTLDVTAKAGRLRIGFLGADFYNQATMHLMIGLIEEHDRNQFEYIAYDSGSSIDDPIRRRAVQAFDRFHCVSNIGNDEIARMIEQDGIDILIFIRNLTDPRVGVLTQRPAPIQVAYLYNPSGFGAPAVDFLIADSVIVPPEFEHHYSERIARLPFSYQPNDRHRPLPQECTRLEFGLPEGRVVLANLGSPFKITPTMFDIWCRILREHPQCVLWLLQTKITVAENLRLEASLRGIDPARMYFAPLEAIPRHITRLSCADLMLDTHPYGGHTGSSDALWAGVPVLTLVGETFASRVAASLLNAAGLSELAARSETEYVDLASRLIEDRRALAAYRSHLVSRRMSLPLFDVCSYARDFENLLLDLWSERSASAGRLL